MQNTLVLGALVFVGLIVLIGCALVIIQIVRKKASGHEPIRTIANIVAAGAALAIPIVVYQAAERARISEINTARDTRTLQLMIDVDHLLSGLVAEKIRLDEVKSKTHGKFDYDYITDKDNKDVRKVVFGILNEYEAVCVGVNQRLLSLPIVWAMRGDPLIETFAVYGKFIADYRSKKNPDGSQDLNAWADCLDLAKELEHHRPTLNEAMQKTKQQRFKSMP